VKILILLLAFFIFNNAFSAKKEGRLKKFAACSPQSISSIIESAEFYYVGGRAVLKLRTCSEIVNVVPKNEYTRPTLIYNEGPDEENCSTMHVVYGSDTLIMNTIDIYLFNRAEKRFEICTVKADVKEKYEGGKRYYEYKLYVY